MAVSRAMRRLLRMLEMQEEQCLAQVEAALADLRQLESALTAAGDQDRAGRRMISASAATGETVNLLAGLEECRAARRREHMLRPRIVEAQRTVNIRRGELLNKRVARRQAETVVEKMDAADASEANRKIQRELDDWFLGKMRHTADEDSA
jgi:hypothetical protein